MTDDRLSPLACILIIGTLSLALWAIAGFVAYGVI